MTPRVSSHASLKRDPGVVELGDEQEELEERVDAI